MQTEFKFYFFCNLNINNFAKTIPINIVITKRIVPALPFEIDTTTGPGQNPPRPHPIPNIAEPVSKYKSRFVFWGIRKESSKSGVWRFLTNQKPGIVIKIAPPITNAKLGSQEPKRSKKFCTFAGLVMPDIIKPIPKINPVKTVTKLRKI